MKLVINLEDVSVYGEDEVADVIRAAIRSEIERFVKTLVKEALRENERQMRTIVKKAASKDWKKVATALAWFEDATTEKPSAREESNS